MAPESKRKKFIAIIRKPFSPKKDEAVSSDVATIAQTPSPAPRSSAVVTTAVMGEPSPSTYAPEIVIHESTNQVPEIAVGSGSGFFSHSSHFSVNHPIMIDNSTKTTINISNDQRSKAMKHLSEHIIHGAARDSSARSPVPKCHPGTRVEINGHIITWFYDEEKEKVFIWVFGPAGVGKSAIMQTLADKLAEAHLLGASVFISRPNGRNSSRHLFLTVGYQLAVHIEEYCTYITEKLARDPELVDKGIEEQFKTFIMEPFADKRIGAGLKPRGVLLDGLDELDEHRSQKQIIRLVGDFVLKYPDVPILWAISSRPEPHISDTFNEEQVIPSYWSKYVPVDSEQSIRDVELFIRDDLDRIRREFPRRVPKEWPSEEQISKLAAAASGFFIFAQTALRFIEDPRYADPTTRLNQVLSALSGPLPPSSSQPFARLDVLYSRVLEDIPYDIWPITKRVIGVLLAFQIQGKVDILRTPAGIAVILGLELTTVYTALNGCYSLLYVSDAPNAVFEGTQFYHASFGDYLLDPSRSQSFCISLGDVENDLLKSYVDVWEKFKTDNPPTSGLTYEDRWAKYFSTIIPYENDNFHKSLTSYIHEALVTILVEKHDPNGMTFSSKEDQDQCFNLLSQLEYGTACDIFSDYVTSRLWPWLFDMWEAYRDVLVSRGIITAMRLEQFQFFCAKTAYAELEYNDKSFSGSASGSLGHDDLYNIIHHQSYDPQLPVLSCGSFETGCLVFRHQLDAPESVQLRQKYIVIPIPNSIFYHDAEHLLTNTFDAIRTIYPHMIPPTWPSREQFLKLAGAMSHHFVFASIAIRFIGNPYAVGNPVTRLDQLLALIDEVDPSDDHPFIYVDALYTHILDTVSPDMWPTTKQVLDVLLNSKTSSCSFFSLQYPKGISVTFGTKLIVVDAALNGCYPMLLTPSGDPLERVIFHASFYGYLIDSTRSKKFSISTKQSLMTALEVLCNFWLCYKRWCHGSSDKSQWVTYCSQRHSDFSLSNYGFDQHLSESLSYDVHKALAEVGKYGPMGLESPQIQGLFFDILGQLDYFTVSEILVTEGEFFVTLLTLWNAYQMELSSRGLFHEIEFRELRLDHCNTVRHGGRSVDDEDKERFWWRSPQDEEEKEYEISSLRVFQQQRPQLQVLIGGTAGGRFAAFEYEYTEDDSKIVKEWEFKRGRAYYVIPYPDEV